jgi:SAM-dependent methyltransferase
MTTPQTWHYGIVAEWWAEFNHDGPEIQFFGRYVQAGQPALDAGCGAGRLLVPWLQAGYDVDGCDVSPDMVERCRERATREGLQPTLFVQGLHELTPPRTYRTIVVCGVFGIGSTRRQDEAALVRIHDALEPGGLLLLDNEAPYADARLWRRWVKEERDALPAPWPERGKGTAKVTADGAEIELLSRVVEVDPLDQRATLEMRATKRRDGVVLAAEERTITLRAYFRDELLLMLDRAGFAEVEVFGDYDGGEATADSEFIVFAARAAGGSGA